MITVGLLLVKPPLWVDGLVTLGILVGLWCIYRPIARRGSPGGSAIPSEMMASSREKRVISMAAQEVRLIQRDERRSSSDEQAT